MIKNKTNKKRILSSILVVLILITQLTSFNFTAKAEGASSIIDLRSIDGWTQVYQANGQNDPQGDQQTGGSTNSVSQDIVGDSTNPSTYIKFSTDKTELAVRVRVNNYDGTLENPQFGNFTFAGVDANGNGTVDFFLGAYNPTGSNGRLGIYNADPSALNTGPSNTGISGKPLLAFEPVKDVNYSIIQAGSNIFNNPDYFITYKFKVADISNAILNKTKENVAFTADTAFRFITGTAAQDNSFNQDISGMDKSGWGSGKTWSELNVFSPVTSVNGGTYYAVTFDKNTGDIDASPAAKIIQSGSSLGTLPSTNPTKRGMYFQEWNKIPDGTGETVTASTTINADTTVYAIWGSKPLYTVTFQGNGGGWTDGATAKTTSTNNGVIGENMPENPVKPGGYFIGWGTATTLNQSTIYDSQMLISEDITLYALWDTRVANTANFYDNVGANGGQVIATLYTNPSGQIQSTLPNPTRIGYTFSGWYDNINGTGTAFTGGSKINNNMNYYAKWTPTNYTLTYDGNGGLLSGASSTDVTNGKFVVPALPTRAGYIFLEWNQKADGTGEPMYPSSDITANTTVYAIWQPLVTVTFDANGGAFDEGAKTTIDVKNKKLIELPIPPSKSGYTFLGWSTSPTSTSLVNLTSDFNSSTTLYAVWSPVYTVTFDANNGAWNGNISETDVLTAYGNVLYFPEDPIRDGYEFEGWSTSKEGTVANFSTDIEVKDNITVYAVWSLTVSPSSYTVSFESNGGSPVTAAIIIVGEHFTKPADPTKPDHSFGGWYKDANCTTPWNFETDKVTADTILFAKWNVNSYTVTFDSNGGSTVASQNTNSDTTILAPTEPTKTEHSFDGWYKEATLTTPWNFESDKVTADTILFAKWNINSYFVNFDSQGGSEVTAIQANYNDKITAPVAPTRTGYSFIDWYTDNVIFNIAFDFENTFITETKTLYAKWNINSYNVNFDSQGGSAVTGIQANYNDKITVPTAPTKKGYTFAGWYKEEACTNEWNFESDQVTAATSLYAKWNINSYNVNFDSQGGNAVTGIQANYNDKITAPVAPTKTGYTFAGWYKEEVSTNEWNFESDQVTAVTTLYAKWNINSYSVNFDSQGGSVVTGIQADYNDKIKVPSAPTKTGYTFAGWYKEAAGTNAWNFGSDQVSADTTLYAKWNINSYTITFNSQDGSAVGSQSINFGEKAGEPSAPLKPGFGFGGWYKDAACTIPWNFSTDTVTADTILYAKWSAGSYTVSGDVKDEDKGTPVPNVEVSIERGGKLISGPVKTDADGNFKLTGVPAGVYNLVIRATDNKGNPIIVTQIITVTGDFQLGTIKIPLGRKNTIYVPKANVPVDVVGKLDQVFDNVTNTQDDLGVTLNDLQIVKDGGEVTIRLESNDVNEITQANQISDVKTAINKDKKHLGYMWDLSVFKDVTPFNGSKNTRMLKELNNLVDIYISLPKGIQGKKGYAVYRYHDGIVNTITEVPNERGEKITVDGNTFILTVQKFSVYAISYDRQNDKVTVEDGKTDTTVNPINGTEKSISGTGEPGSTITVTLPNGSTVTGKVDASGKWRISLSTALPAGSNVTVIATDAAGHKSDSVSVKVARAKAFPVTGEEDNWMLELGIGLLILAFGLILWRRRNLLRNVQQ